MRSTTLRYRVRLPGRGPTSLTLPLRRRAWIRPPMKKCGDYCSRCWRSPTRPPVTSDVNGTVTRISPEGRRTCGFNLAEALGIAASQLIARAETDRVARRPRLGHALQAGGVPAGRPQRHQDSQPALHIQRQSVLGKSVPHHEVSPRVSTGMNVFAPARRAMWPARLQNAWAVPQLNQRIRARRIAVGPCPVQVVIDSCRTFGPWPIVVLRGSSLPALA
jgi:hypothetical protein